MVRVSGGDGAGSQDAAWGEPTQASVVTAATAKAVINFGRISSLQKQRLGGGQPPHNISLSHDNVADALIMINAPSAATREEDFNSAD